MIPSAGLVPGTVLLQAPEEDAGTVSWRLYRNPLRVLEAWRQEEVLPLLQEVEAALAQGRHAAGFLAYEAAPAFDPALTVHPSKPGLPLAWFGLYAGWEPAEPPPAESEPAAALPLPDWRPSLPEADYRDAVTRIREKIAAGETYQVNFTLRLRADWPENCDPAAFFHAMCRAQRPLRCAALVHAGRHLLLSASPELFFDRAGDGHITGRPMKGTAPRRPDAAGDRAAAAVLAACPKNRAENVMITDMIRNDLGRIAVPGSVAAPRLFETETYSTLHQLTSTVTARTAAALPELLGALFPCASITGAPKVQAMRIIRELEADPRGIYTGAIGFAEPGGRARFNVAIRTVDLDLKTGCAEFGAGGGVVWDSTPEGEYAECLIKARVLTARRPRFHLFETLRWTPARGFTLLRRHLDRLAASAAYFSFPLDEAIARYALHQEVANSVTAAPAPPGPRRVRLLLAADGELTVTSTPLPQLIRPRPCRPLAFAAAPVDRDDLFLHHKTTRRETYDRAMTTRPEGADDVLLWNHQGEVTESAIANLVARLDGILVTPPAACGLLPGTFRAALLARGRIRERILNREDVRRAEALWLVNSVRGWIPARIH